MRFSMRTLSGAFSAAMMLGLVSAPTASAAPIPIATLQSIPGIPTFYLSLDDFSLSTIDLPNPYPPGDPFNPSAPITYTQQLPSVGPLPGLMTLAPLGPTAVIDVNNTLYGPGSFQVAFAGPSNSIPWLSGSFAFAVLNLDGSLEGSFSNLDGTTLSGFGLTISGLDNPGSFAFQLGNAMLVPGATGAPVGVTFEITHGAVFAQVPEPASLLLLGCGLVPVVCRRWRRS